MKVSPINQNQYKTQNPSFNAINQKYYKQAVEEVSWGTGNVTGNLIHCIQYDVLLYKILSPQDGLDTLKAIRELIKPNKDEWINELIGEFKQLAKQERIEARRVLKKIKKP